MVRINRTRLKENENSFRTCLAGQQRSVLLEDVKTLTLQKGQRTEARRVSAVPQLKCVGGAAKGAFEPEVVQCYNRGSNGVDIQVSFSD